MIIEQNLDKITKFPFNDYSIDKIYCYGLLEHLKIESVVNLLKECYRILKYKGNIHIKVPNSFYMLQRLVYLFGVFPSDFVLVHDQHFSHQQLEQLLYSVGFKIPTKENALFYFPFRKLLMKDIYVKARKTE